MFRTPIAAEEPMFGRLFGDDYRVWKYVELTLAHVWFYVSTVERAQTIEVKSILMIDSVTLLNDLLSASHAGRYVESIHLVTPSRLNESGDWRMERLFQIEHLSDEGSEAYLYKVQNNITYVDGDRSLTVNENTQRREIFIERLEQAPESRTKQKEPLF
ncbi:MULTISPECIES: hypothetical protein [Pseudomonas]|jgi:hypothetical protein|uniref:hypothetical protein n=1 Tax=Pseudomonas TaxID=286 RepID=UPI000CFF4164|nr:MULTISPECIES: hypothetical protein [Pseudomonas]PRA54707.1 hypothetical protein CQZ98_11190 [Pseudomonas sp. MYb115]QXN49709.1 hypothetical protein KW062_26200 [Pseudomonas fluorescens]WSO24023.1 hypothetical protein VUJ50_26360 [Pseudomonas fluorescens]